MAHTRNGCAVCKAADEECRAAMVRWKHTNNDHDWQVVRSKAAARARTKHQHLSSLQPRNPRAYTIGFSSDFGVYQGGLPELGKDN